MSKKIIFCLIYLFILTGCRGDSAERDPQILYLWRDSAEIQQIFSITLAGDSTQLTQSQNDIKEFVAAPNGEAMAYIEGFPDGSSQLWVLQNPRKNGGNSAEKPIDCSQLQCRGPIWANDNRRLIYERRDLAGNNPRLWWLDTETGDTLPVFIDETIRGYGARFSADNSKISYIRLVDPTVSQLYGEGHFAGDGHNHGAIGNNPQQIIQLFDFETGAEQAVPNLMNAVGAWHPTKTELLTTDMQFFQERFGIHILHIDQPTGTVSDFGEGILVEDSSPAWSPDGEWIAFGRKQAQAAMGAQLWLMRPDGSEAAALTQDADIHHGRLAWQPDGSAILFQHFNISSPQSEPSIWLFNLEENAATQLTPHGIMPAWLP